MVLDNSVLDLIRKKIASSKSDDDSADQTSIVKDVTQNIKLLLKVTPLLSPREIIQYCSLYTSLVCENYLYTAIEEIPSLLLHNSVQI